MKKGKLFVISGPSGVGKDTVINKVLENNKKCWRSISFTTRDMRDNEVDGVDYYFVSLNEFLDNINKNNFLEYEEVYNGCFYGTPKDKVFKMLNKGNHVILKIDVTGALNVKKVCDQAILIFIAPPSIEELQNRLIKRNTESAAQSLERIKKAKWEISLKEKYDYVVVNEDVEQAVSEIESIINSYN